MGKEAISANTASSLFMNVASATIRRSPNSGGNAIAHQVGDHLADVLTEHLAAMLEDVMPASVLKTIGDDVLQGAEAISQFIYGDVEDRRKVYHLAQTSKIPVFRMGSLVCARKSTLLRWIADQEAKCSGGAAA